jgi:hypothetical protein
MRKLPFDLVRVNIKVDRPDWEWMLANRPGQVNRVLRHLLKLYVAREQAKGASYGNEPPES